MEGEDGFRVVVTRGATGIELAVRGELDLETSPQLRRAVGEALADAPADVAVVLRDVTFMDSTGLVALLDARDDARAAGHELALAEPSAPVRQVLELTGLDRELGITPEGGRS